MHLTYNLNIYYIISVASIAQPETCLTTDTCLAADPGVASLIPAQSHTFVEIDHEIIDMAIQPLIQKGYLSVSKSMLTKHWFTA